MSEGSEDDGQEKSFDATETKIRQAREKGDTPQSTETNTLLLYAGLIVGVLVGGAYAAERTFIALTSLLARPSAIADQLLTSGDSGPFGDAFAGVLLGLVPIFLLPITFVLLALIIQRAIIFAPSKLMPKLSRISPISNAKQKYGPDGMVEFFKRFAKLIFITVISGLFFVQTFFKLSGLSLMPAAMMLQELRDEMVLLTFYMLLAMAIITFIDLPYSIFSHLKKLRMSFQEIKDESKQNEGDPHMKGERRARARAIAQGNMMRDVAGADVVIVNPTHYAVALKWSRQPGSVPVCVAKGVDDVAAQIRLRAQQNDVPIHSDPPCARSLHALVDIGADIQPEHFAAVAAAIHFADKLKRKPY